jgi:hypothetical protein
MPKWWPKRKKDPAVIDAPSLAQTAAMDLFSSRGDDYTQNGDYSTAVVMYTEALKHAPADTVLLISRSFAHMMSTPPKLDLALQDADVAIRHNPTSWQAWLQRGETLLRQGDVTRAEEALQTAVEFAQGLDKLTAQRSLADARARRCQISPTPPEPSSTVPAQTPALSLPTTPPSYTPSFTGVSLAQNSTTAISGSLPPAPSSSARTAGHSMQTPRPSLLNTPNSMLSIPPNTQPSGKLTPCSYSKPICSNWNPIKEEPLRMALISRSDPLPPLQHQSRPYHPDSEISHQKLLQATHRTPPIQIPQSGSRR